MWSTKRGFTLVAEIVRKFREFYEIQAFFAVVSCLFPGP
jgi:hypothetical protein